MDSAQLRRVPALTACANILIMVLQPNRVIARIVVGILLCAALVLVGFGLAQPTNSIQFAVGAGVLSSLLASVILGFFASRSLAVQNNLADKLMALDAAASSRSKYGATLLADKYEHKPEHWNNLLAASSQRLFLVGHALTTWVAPAHRKHFLTAIERIIRSGGDFCIIVLDPSGDAQTRIRDTRGSDYTSKVEVTLQAIAEVYDRLPIELKEKVDVRYMPRTEQPLYMAVITDSNLEYSPYFMRASTRTTLHASFLLDTPFAAAVLADFDALRKACPRVDLAQHVKA